MGDKEREPEAERKAQLGLVSVCDGCGEKLTEVFPDLAGAVGFIGLAIKPADISKLLTREQKKRVRRDIDNHRCNRVLTNRPIAYWGLIISAPKTS